MVNMYKLLVLNGTCSLFMFNMLALTDASLVHASWVKVPRLQTELVSTIAV